MSPLMHAFSAARTPVGVKSTCRHVFDSHLIPETGAFQACSVLFRLSVALASLFRHARCSYAQSKARPSRRVGDGNHEERRAGTVCLPKSERMETTHVAAWLAHKFVESMACAERLRGSQLSLGSAVFWFYAACFVVFRLFFVSPCHLSRCVSGRVCDTLL